MMRVITPFLFIGLLGFPLLGPSISASSAPDTAVVFEKVIALVEEESSARCKLETAKPKVPTFFIYRCGEGVIAGTKDQKGEVENLTIQSFRGKFPLEPSKRNAWMESIGKEFTRSHGGACKKSEENLVPNLDCKAPKWTMNIQDETTRRKDTRISVWFSKVLDK